MASSLLLAEISATCSAIGLLQDDTYYPSEECVETLKDLIRYLRRDGDSHEIRRKLGEAKVVVFDLIPLIRGHSQNKEILSNCLRLLVNLTNPVMFLFGEDLPTEKVARNHCEEIEEHLVCYKQAFADQSVWEVFSNVLNEVFRKEPIQRGEDDNQMIQRILILMCNLLRIPPSPFDYKRTDTDTSLHEELLWCLNTSGMNDILTYLASTEQESSFFMHLLEIFHFMFAGRDPKVICNVVKERSENEKRRDQLELAALKEAERQTTTKKLKDRNTSSRHSRFGGTFVVRDFKAIGEEDLIIHKPVSSLESVDLNKYKPKRRALKSHRPMQEEKKDRISAFSIRLFMREFCIGILKSGGYQLIMHHAKRMIDSMATQPNDETFYLWAMWFFMRFNEYDCGQVKYISETLNVQTFHFVSTQLEKYYDSMNTDKKHIQVWSKRMHYAVKVYQVLLCTLRKMDSDPHSATRQSSSVIKRNILYSVDYRELLLTLLLTYDECKYTLLYLSDLVKTTHIFLRMLEHFCGKTSSSLVIQEANKKRKPRKQKKKKQNTEAVPTLEQSWESLAPELSAVLQQIDVPLPEVVPFDATLETPMDDQRAIAMSNIRQHLLDCNPEMAVSLLRAARDVWPENDCFGTMNMSITDEFTALRDIFMTVLPGEAAPSLPVSDEDEDEEEEPPEHQVTETQFNFLEFVNRFAQPQVVCALVKLLSNFLHNDEDVNHAVLKLMFRIAKDIGSPALLYQLPLFITFQKIFKANRPCDQELITFSKYLLNLFRKSSMANPKVYCEVLFPITKRDAVDVVDGSYMEVQDHIAWNTEEEQELCRLFEEYQAMEGGGNALDVGDWVTSNLIRQDRTKRGVNRKLRELGFNLEAVSRSRKQTKAPNDWGDDELEELNTLWEQFRESDWPLGNILDNLTVKRGANRVSEKILELGLATSKTELHKKRKRKQARSPSDGASDESGNQSTDDESLVNCSPAVRKIRKLPRKERKRSVTSGREDGRHKHNTCDPTKIDDALRTCIVQGYSDTLEWLREQFQFALGDDEVEEEMPMLPSTAAVSEQIRLDCFQALFSHIGVVYVDQSVYPRISASQKRHDIVHIISRIEAILKEVVNGVQ